MIARTRVDNRGLRRARGVVIAGAAASLIAATSCDRTRESDSRSAIDDDASPPVAARARTPGDDATAGFALWEERRYAAAAIPLAAAFARQPELPLAGERLAECQIECERFEEAAAVARRALAISLARTNDAPDGVGAAERRSRAKLAFLVALASKHLGRFADCEAAARVSLDAAPGSIASRTLLAGALRAQSKHEEAVAELRRALAMLERAELRAGRAQIHYQLAQSLFALGRSAEASSHLELHASEQQDFEDAARRERATIDGEPPRE